MGGRTAAGDVDRGSGVVMTSGGVPGTRDASRREGPQDLHHLPLALTADGAPRAVAVGCGRVRGGRGRRGFSKQVAGAGDRGPSVPIGEQPEVPDAHEAARQDVHQKAPKEFLDAERHDFRAPVIRVVLPAEPHEAIGEADQSGVRDGDAVGVAAEIPQHALRPGKGALRLDDPGRRAELGEEGGETPGVGERGRAGREGERARVEGVLQAPEILRPEDERERLDRKQKGPPSANPAGAVGGQRAPGDETVHMEMLREGLTPRVQDGGDADGAAEVAGVAPEGEQGLGGRPEQERVEHPRIALRERIERVGQREDHMEVGNRQELRTPRLEPASTRLGLTRGTVSIATRVVGQTCGAAVVTRLPTPA